MAAEASSTPMPRDELATDHLLSDIGRRTVRGGAVMFIAQAVKAVAQFGAVIVLARLLNPADFGLVAMAAALATILDPMKELGLSSATIQKPDLRHDQVSLLFWVNVAAGAAIAAALFFGAPLIASFYREPELIGVTRWFALSFLLGGFGVQHWALLRRQMRFAAAAIMEMSAELFGFAAAILLALQGAGYWALVAQRLIAPALILVASWSLCRWRPSWPRRAEGARELFNFGGSVSLTTILTLAARNVDQVLIGWLWGSNAVGLYERSSKLLTVPVNNLCIPFYSLGMPLFSRLVEQEERYRRAFGEMLEKLAMVTLPGGALLAVTADWVTDILFGPQWRAAAPLVAWFGFSAGYQPILLTLALLYLSQNRPADFLRATVIDLVIGIGSILVGVPFGATVVAASLAVAGFTLRLPVGIWLSTRRGPVAGRDVYALMVPPISAAIAVAVAVMLLRQSAVAATLSPLIGLGIATPVAAMVAAVVYVLFPQSRSSLVGLPELVRQFTVARKAG
jgi:polysaccharide transporter, PST family